MKNWVILILSLYSALAMAQTDPALKSVSRDFRSPTQAATSILQMSQVLQERGDRRGLFPQIYALTITATEARLERGEFYNPEWVQKLIVNYANIYRRTIYKELQGQRQDLPLAWQLEFVTAESESWTPALDVVYSINVHIARDLIEALFATPAPLSEETYRQDFFLISETLAETMPQIWSVFLKYSQSIPIPDCIEQTVMLTWITDLRRGAWENARLAYDQPWSARQAFLREVDRKILQKAERSGIFLPVHSR